MGWLLSNWDAIVGAAGAVYGVVQKVKAKKAQRKQAELAAQLDAIRTTAGTKASWEDDLSEQARAARARAKLPPPR